MKSTIYCIILFASSLTLAEVQKEKTGIKGGAAIDVLIEYPAGITNNPAPLCLVLGGGQGKEKQAKKALSKLGTHFAEQGWVIASPISPTGNSFFGSNAEKIVKLANALQAKPGISKEKILIAGISNGGICGIIIASLAPGRFAAVIAVPGIINQSIEFENIKGLPIYLRVGEHDKFGWEKHFDTTVKYFKRYNAILNAKLLKDTGHGIPLDWPEIDQWLKDVLSRGYRGLPSIRHCP